MMKRYSTLMNDNEQPCPCPSPSPAPHPPSSLFKDISNFKTPKRPPRNPNFSSPCSQFFTASKRTPMSSSSCRRPSLGPGSSFSSTRSKAATATARRLKAFEVEQSRSSRKAQLKIEQSHKLLEKSLTVWLNFLFENPKSCGCDLSISGDSVGATAGAIVKGKREGSGVVGGVIGVDGDWRSPKRFRDLWWRVDETESTVPFSSSKFSLLRESLKHVCSFDDFKQRLHVYLSLGCCKEILDVMTQVTKNIDEGRIQMKPHCPVVTDVGMKEKASRILMCYNPTWLRIGLYIIFGGDSLLSNVDVNSDKEMAFLKMMIEKQFFSHAGLAKDYAYNKKVEGLYRPGYYESLGSIILKRILLLVLILDRAKSLSSLPLNYGIDGVDGGSPLLFKVQPTIKASRDVLHNVLSSDVMHGEGNLLAHLVIVGYKVPYQQCPLTEFDFKVTDLFMDVQDGLRICRAIQLLQHDTSILMKLVVPSDNRKKKLANCEIALEYLKKAGVELHDDDQMEIMGDAVVNGDKELTLSLLWNAFVRLQLPLLVNKKIIAEEINKARGMDLDHLNNMHSTPSEMLLNWIQAICEKYDFKVDNFSSLTDGKAIWCLLDYYFRTELSCSCSLEEDSYPTRGEESIMLGYEETDGVHNFILSQKLTALLGNFPEVLPIGDLLEHNRAPSSRSVIIFLAFLSSQLTVKENLDQFNFHKLLCCNCHAPRRRISCIERCSIESEVERAKKIYGHSAKDAANRFKAVQAWWQGMTEGSYNRVIDPAASNLKCLLVSNHHIDIQQENAAKVIQSHFRRFFHRCKYMKMMNSVCLLQIAIRVWLTVKQKPLLCQFSFPRVQELYFGKQKKSELLTRYAKLIVDRHEFVKLRRSVLLIQHAARSWIARTRHGQMMQNEAIPYFDLTNSAIIVQKHARGWLARLNYPGRVAQIEKILVMCKQKGASDLEVEAADKIKHALKNVIFSKCLHEQTLAANKIQAYFHGWLLWRNFLDLKRATIKIQKAYRCLRCRRASQKRTYEIRSAIIIQSHARGWISRRWVWKYKSLTIVIQSHCRGWLVRRQLMTQREAIVKIQNTIRSLKGWKSFHCQKQAAIEIQRFVRGQISRKRILGASCFDASTIPNGSKYYASRGSYHTFEMRTVMSSVLKLQTWWKGVMLHKVKTKSTLIIQTHVRGWIARRKASRDMHLIILIQSYWKGYLARKESRGELADVRLRIQRSAKNVDDSKRIINRLLSALKELRGMKSVTGILHICATFDMATEHSLKCCEELVAGGAIETLLKLIHSVSRSIPDQQVLKHALSTLKNLARHSHLVEVLINTKKSVEIIFWELLRNKDEGFFIASAILKKICLNPNGNETVCKLHFLLKRLHILAEELTRKTMNDKRNTKHMSTKDNTERKKREVIELLKLTINRQV